MTDNIKNEFNELSGSQDFITKEQMIKYMEDHGVENGNTKVQEFFNTLDTNNDGKVSFEEFSVGYVTAKHKNLIDFLPQISQSMVVVKQAQDKLKVDQGKKVSVNLEICDEDCPKVEELPYRMSLNIGFSGSNPNQDCFKDVNIVGGHKVGFYFEAGENAEEVTGQVEEQMKDFVELLKEFGPEVAEHVEALEVISEHKGTQSFVGIDLQNSMFAMIAQQFVEGISGMLKESQAQLTMNLGTTLDLSDVETLKNEQLKQAKYLFQLSTNMQSGLDMAQVGLSQTQELTKEKDHTIFAALLASSVSKLNLTLNFDPERRQKHFEALSKGEEFDGAAQIEQIKKMLEESGFKDQLSTFSQANEIYTVLKDNNVKQWGVFASMDETLVTLDLHGDMYKFVDAIELFE